MPKFKAISYDKCELSACSMTCVCTQEYQERLASHRLQLQQSASHGDPSVYETLVFKTTEIDKLREIVKEYWNINNVRFSTVVAQDGLQRIFG